jgi:ABC-type glycerol-3-phosphate transport system permease component
MALALITSVPVLAILLAQRRLMAGRTIGAIR